LYFTVDSSQATAQEETQIAWVDQSMFTWIDHHPRASVV
jgi:hypothetical protein